MDEYNVTKIYFVLQTALPSAAVFTVLSDSDDTDTGDEAMINNNSDEVPPPSNIPTFSEICSREKQPF